MITRLSKSLLAKIYDHAEAEYPNESCGYLVQELSGKFSYFPCVNASKDPKNSFVIPPESYLEAEKLGTVMGVVHSHPDCQTARPSGNDRIMCDHVGLPYHIVSYPQRDYQCIMPEDKPLLGRPFVLGATDCGGLLLDWLATYGIELPAPPVQPDYPWWEDPKATLYSEKTFTDNGFIMQDQPTPGSIIVMQIRAPVANHVGIILPGNVMLHHMCGKLSCREMYGEYYRERTWFICRHKDLPPEEEITDVT